jgi:hypothetical protein
MRRIGSGIVIAGCVAGCAVTSVDGDRMRLKSDRFADYVEATFRRQNAVSTDLAIEIDEEGADSVRYTILETAERRLLADCRGLNELARARRDGESASGLGALKRARGTPDCERATAAAEAALESVSAKSVSEP